MKKAAPNEILKRVRERTKPKRQPIAFRLDKALVDAFRAYCEKEKVPVAETLEELMRHQIGKM